MVLCHDISSDLHKMASLTQTVFALELPTETCAVRAISLLNCLCLGFSLSCLSTTECSSRGKGREVALWPQGYQLSHLLTHTGAEVEDAFMARPRSHSELHCRARIRVLDSVVELAWEVSGGQETAFRPTFLVSDSAL